MQAIFPITIPKQWYRGTDIQTLSLKVYLHRSAIKNPLLTIFIWLNAAPLGEPKIYFIS